MLRAHRTPRGGIVKNKGRFRFLSIVFFLAAFGMIARLGYLQIMQYGLYALYASDQHETATKLLPTRGQILVRDRVGVGATQASPLHPLATNRLSWQVYAVPKDISDPIAVARRLAEILKLPEEGIVSKLTKRKDDPYELIAKDVGTETVENVRAQKITGVGFLQSSMRFYPESGIGGQLLGFIVTDQDGRLSGRYGLEGAFENVLAGTPGSILTEKDAGGRRLTFARTVMRQAVNGSDIVLTLDRTIQFKACESIKQAVERHRAQSGSIVVMNPHTGAILALCSSPDFDPAEYGKVQHLGILTNPVTFGAYEPGSVFKGITMAAGLDAEKITPKKTFIDRGVEEIDGFRIRNSDGKAYGAQTMVEVLAKSLNTGTIFVQRLLGRDIFRRYVEGFGFGQKTNIELGPEAKGTIISLQKKGSIFGATASFGQGISMTPIQLLAAYGALSNGGRLMRPYVVEEIVRPDGSRVQTKPQLVGQPISARTSRLISGMLVAVVESGHGKRAGVPGYWVAGKTGTAQVPRVDGPGYQKDVTIGSFAGYAPASDPKFVMLVKIDNPRDVQWAESSAAPVFGDMAKFLLTYFEVPPERPIRQQVVPPPPIAATSVSSTPMKPHYETPTIP